MPTKEEAVPVFGDVVEFVHLLSVRFLSLSAETLNRFGHG
jgi:hypothetical protein